MNIEIKHRHTGAIILCGEYESVKDCLNKNRNANLQGADLWDEDLQCADFWYANLQGANLQGANLRCADFRYANLQDANLRGAKLWYANLQCANLRGAKNLNKYITSPLYMLLDQPGKIIAYKLVKADGLAPINGGITYEIGKEYEVKNAETDENKDCAKGINLATLDWCLQNLEEGYRIFKAEFTSKDIACIPLGTDGKFRVFRCKIVEEVDYKKIGVKK